MNPDFFWVPGPWRGKLAVIGRPRGGDWLDDEVHAWRQSGLDVVVSLLEAEEAAELQLEREGIIAASRNIELLSFPIPDRGVPASAKEALSLLSSVAAKLGQGKNVAIHCRQSVGRSGLIAAGLLIVSGVAVDQAIAVVSASRGQTIPETRAQVLWIRQLPAEQLALTK